MLDLRDEDLIKACSKPLRDLYRSERMHYIRFFLQNRYLPQTHVDLEPLIRAGVVAQTGMGLKSLFRVFPVKGRFIVTDYHSSGRSDKVFPIQVDESAYFAQNLQTEETRFALDLFTGSGIYPIFCAPHVERVYAVDISDRALNFARFNSILNGVNTKIEFLNGHVFHPVPKIKFDLIIAAPPYVPTPPGCHREMLAEASGWDGLRYPLEFLEHAKKYLGPNGRIQLYVGTVGNSEKSSLENHLLKKFRKERLRIFLDALYRRPVRLETLIGRRLSDPIASGLVVDAEELQIWQRRLREMDHSHFYYLMITIEPGRKFEIIKRMHRSKIRKDLYLVSDPERQAAAYVSRLLRQYCD